MQSIAIFADRSGKRFIRLKSGQWHAGWTLRKIALRSATMEKDQRLVTLVLPARNELRLSPVLTGTGAPKPPWLSSVGNLPQSAPVRQTEQAESIPDAPKPPWLNAALRPPPQIGPARQIEQTNDVPADAPKPPWLNAAVNPPPQSAPIRQIEQGDSKPLHR